MAGLATVAPPRGSGVALQDNYDVNYSLIRAVREGELERTRELINLFGLSYSKGWHKGYTPLHCAAEKGITEVVQLLLDSGANVDAKGEDSNTPLHIAVFRGKENIVELLLRYGATVDNQDKNGKTALRLAVENAYAYASPLPTIEDILKYRPDINNQSNRECLKIAVRGYARWFKEVVEALLRYGFSVNPEDTNNTEFLHAAFEKGYVKIVEDFLKYGANVNTLLGPSGHGKGLTPLHIAVINKQEEMANLLISNKADINARDENGKTPIFYATKNADLKLTKFLLANEANVKNSPEVLFQAVETECMEIVKVLLSYDADVNASDKYGQTALHLIALQDDGFSVVRKCMVCNPRGNEVLGRNSQVKEAIAKLLLNKGAGVDARTIKGETALHFAIQNENVKVVETILEYNANVNLGTKNGDMPLCLSSLTGNVEICTMLLNKGANVNVKKNGGISALHIAAQNHHGNIVKLLLNYGARVNSQDNDGRTALHYACYNGSIETVEELLEHGSDINITSKNGCTALDDNAAGIKSFYSDLNTYDSDASDYFDADRGIYRGNITLKLIICLIVKMKTANLYRHVQGIKVYTVNSEMNKFK
ncbi:hypothetical protein QYM36_010456 [Artemia franciscana]|uniref:Uncharacterized protein n=1 Tax=Artemia franciscana TaxID=6661 RepID=A0AA88LC20_ARTSF|nr:hypothetical protein QYM36_010456 [Artemia franciscana]